MRYDVDNYHTFSKRHGRIQSSQLDDNLYVVVDTGAGYADRQALAMGMIVPFELMNSDKGLRIFPMTCIRSGLAVITNRKTKTSTHYLALCPRVNWGTLFTSRIRHWRECQNVTGEEEDSASSGDESVSSQSYKDWSVESTSDEGESSSGDEMDC